MSSRKPMIVACSKCGKSWQQRLSSSDLVAMRVLPRLYRVMPLKTEYPLGLLLRTWWSSLRAGRMCFHQRGPLGLCKSYRASITFLGGIFSTLKRTFGLERGYSPTIVASLEATAKASGITSERDPWVTETSTDINTPTESSKSRTDGDITWKKL